MFKPDELAGIVDLFGGLTREELTEALTELAYRHGASVPPDAIDDAVEAFALVEVPAQDREDGSIESDAVVLVPGPTAFPSLPEGAEDLPHILEVAERSIDQEAVGRAAEERLRVEAARAVANDDGDRADDLLDVSYDLEAWTPIDLTSVRERLDEARDGTD